MVSGHGARHGRGRCFTLWRDFMKCVAIEGTYGMNVCREERDDYMECLHHTKLVSGPYNIKFKYCPCGLGVVY